MNHNHCHCEIHKVVHVLDLLAKFVCKLEEHMADFTALKQAVADNAAATDAVVIKIDELNAAVAAGQVDQQPEVDAIVADLTATVERLKAAVA